MKEKEWKHCSSLDFGLWILGCFFALNLQAVNSEMNICFRRLEIKKRIALKKEKLLNIVFFTTFRRFQQIFEYFREELPVRAHEWEKE